MTREEYQKIIKKIGLTKKENSILHNYKTDLLKEILEEEGYSFKQVYYTNKLNEKLKKITTNDTGVSFPRDLQGIVEKFKKHKERISISTSFVSRYFSDTGFKKSDNTYVKKEIVLDRNKDVDFKNLLRKHYKGKIHQDICIFAIDNVEGSSEVIARGVEAYFGNAIIGHLSFWDHTVFYSPNKTEGGKVIEKLKSFEKLKSIEINQKSDE